MLRFHFRLLFGFLKLSKINAYLLRFCIPLQEHDLLDGAVVQAARRLEPKVVNQVINDRCVPLLLWYFSKLSSPVAVWALLSYEENPRVESVVSIKRGLCSSPE